MNDDNGKGLRALFYGLCKFWDIDVWDEEATGPMPADFLLLPSSGHAYVVIVPEPAARQVEIGTLSQPTEESFIILNRDDLNELRLCFDRTTALQQLRYWIRTGRTRAAADRHDLGIGS